MAYTIVRVNGPALRSPFKPVQDDTKFGAESWPALDEYLTTMEQRGWTIVSVVQDMGSTSGQFMITFHRPED